MQVKDTKQVILELDAEKAELGLKIYRLEKFMDQFIEKVQKITEASKGSDRYTEEELNTNLGGISLRQICLLGRSLNI